MSTGWSRTRAGSPRKRSVSLRGSSVNFNLQFRRFSPSSQIWIGGFPGCPTSSKIYNLICLTMRVSSLLEPTLRGTFSSPAVQLEIQVTALYSQLKWRERDGFLSTRKDLRASPLVGEYIFDEELVSQAGNRLQGDVSLKSNTIMLETLAKGHGQRTRAPPQPKRPAPSLPPPVSSKRPKRNPQPTGRGGGNKGKGHFSGQSAKKGKGRGGKRSGRSDTGMHEDTGGVPITGTSFGPITRENSWDAINILGVLIRNRCIPLGHVHRTMGIQDPLCNAAPTETSGTGDHMPHIPHTTYPKGSLKWLSLNQSVQELRNKGAIKPAPLTPGFYSRLFLVTKVTGEWRPIIDLSSLNVLVHCPSFTMETPRSILGALQQGQWLTSLDLKDAYFHIGINPADRRYLRFCHNGTAWQFTVLPFGLSTSPRVFTKILKFSIG